jgi:serine/threonine-protein kinase
MYTTNKSGFVVTRPSNGSSAAPMATYGAIAYSKSTGVYGYSWGQDSRSDAERVALRNCKGSDASVEVHGKNAWVAFAHGSDGASGWAWSEKSAADARQRAVALCAKNGAVGRIQGVSLHTSSKQSWAKFEAQGNAPPQKSGVASENEFFAPNLQIHFKLVKVGGSSGAQLTRAPSANSPALHILVNGSPYYLESEDIIYSLDSLPIRESADILNHHSKTTITFVDHNTGRTFNGEMTLPAYAQTSYSRQ